MAKFFYRMQNILDIKYKLEESAKQEYGEAQHRLNVEEDKLSGLYGRKQEYYEEYQNAILGKLDFLKIEEAANAMDIMDEMIAVQHEVVRKRSKELEIARQKLNQVMQERKMHEKLKEKQFDEFLVELNAQENKETDEVVSYQYNNSKGESEE
ncbi:MAG: flagellar export protein FliJ [Lachnospiraceae bacterium]|nr:flagellar export protein FliJ [Lachnospiraceae bacterium]